jgi:hypothetical protein
MAEFIKNISKLIDCNDLIKRLEINQGFESGLFEGNPTEQEIKELLQRNGDKDIPDDKRLPTDDTSYIIDLINGKYDWELVKWQSFWLNAEFNDIIKIFTETTQKNNIRCFVSRLDPGNVAPYHWDECECYNRTETNLDKIFRYTCFLNTPDIGQTFIVKDKCFYNEEQGNVYQWDHYTDFHGAFNTGTDPHYLLHFVGTTDEHSTN